MRFAFRGRHSWRTAAIDRPVACGGGMSPEEGGAPVRCPRKCIPVACRVAGIPSSNYSECFQRQSATSGSLFALDFRPALKVGTGKLWSRDSRLMHGRRKHSFTTDLTLCIHGTGPTNDQPAFLQRRASSSILHRILLQVR